MHKRINTHSVETFPKPESKMAEMLEWLCVDWKTAMPLLQVPHRSPEFPLLDSKCCLQMRKKNWFGGGYVISLRRETNEDCLQQPFRVTTFIQDPERDSIPLISIHKSVKCTEEDIWSASIIEISNCIPSFPDCDKLKIVCLFHVAPTCTPKCKNETTLNSTEADYEFVEKLTNLSEGKLSSDKGVQACLDVFSDLESLSCDLSKFLECEASPDVMLRCGDRTVPSHTSILAARSRFFADIFRNQMAESDVKTVDVTDIDASVLGLFLKYMYTGEIQGLSENIALSLYMTSNKYAFCSLKDICSEWMIGSLTPENCLECLVFANSNDDEDFQDAAVNFIAEHLQVLKSRAWYTLSEKDPRLANNVYQSCVERNFLNRMSPWKG